MDRRVNTVITLMKNNLHRKISLAEMTRAAQLSPDHLREVFKAETGFAPVRYLKRLRLIRAKDLLRSSSLSVKEIAGQVGVSDISHFVREFQTACSITPTAYRKQHAAADTREPSREANP